MLINKLSGVDSNNPIWSSYWNPLEGGIPDKCISNTKQMSI